MGKEYGAVLQEDAMIERRLRDIELREQLLEHIKAVVKLRKTCENLLDTQGWRRNHCIMVSICPERISTSIVQ